MHLTENRRSFLMTKSRGAKSRETVQWSSWECCDPVPGPAVCGSKSCSMRIRILQYADPGPTVCGSRSCSMWIQVLQYVDPDPAVSRSCSMWIQVLQYVDPVPAVPMWIQILQYVDPRKSWKYCAKSVILRHKSCPFLNGQRKYEKMFLDLIISFITFSHLCYIHKYVHICDNIYSYWIMCGGTNS